MKKQIKKLLLTGLLCLGFAAASHAQIILACTTLVAGPSLLCDSAYYTISPSLPAGITATWSVSGNIHISGSSTGTTVKIVKNSAGTGYINVHISNACGDGDLPTAVITTVDPISVTEVKIVNNVIEDGNWCSSDNANTFEILSDATGSVSYQVEIRKYPSLTLVYSGTVFSGTNSFNPSAGTYSFQVRAFNGVCYGDWFGLDIEAFDCHSPGFRSAAVIFPNPSSTEVNVTYNRPAEKLANGKTAVAKGTYQVKLLNSKGQVLREMVNDVTKTTSKIDVSTIQNGAYIIHIIDKDKTIRKQVIIKH